MLCQKCTIFIRDCLSFLYFAASRLLAMANFSVFVMKFASSNSTELPLKSEQASSESSEIKIESSHSDSVCQTF